MTLFDGLQLLTHFMSLSLLAIGGAITTVPDMHRTLVNEHHWLSDSQFNASIALAQAAPGPNVLFIALLGWNVGLNLGGGFQGGLLAWASAFSGMLLTMLGMLLPSSALTFAMSRWGHQNRELRAVRAFKQGMAPLVVALLMATGWILVLSQGAAPTQWPLWLLTAGAAVLVWQTRLHLLCLLGAGGVVGWFGWV